MEYSFDFLVVDVMTIAIFYKKLNKMLISYINKHDQKTKDSYFCNVQYGKDAYRQIFINYFLNKKKSENIERELDTLLTCAN